VSRIAASFGWIARQDRLETEFSFNGPIVRWFFSLLSVVRTAAGLCLVVGDVSKWKEAQASEGLGFLVARLHRTATGYG